MFVRGLPPHVGDGELSTFFSSAAPVTRAFVVREKDASRASKGFGFVSFAFEEDARAAVAKLNGAELEGRRISVEVATTDGPPRKQEAVSTSSAPRRGPAPASLTPAPTPSETSVIGTMHDDGQGPLAGRKRLRSEVSVPRGDKRIGGRSLGDQQCCMVLFGLPSDFPLARLWKRVKKTQPEAAAAGEEKGSGGEEEEGESEVVKKAMRWPVKLAGSEARPVAIVRYVKKAKRDAAIRKLEGHVLHGHKLRAVAAETVLTGSQAQARGRVIIRNVPFTATVEDLRNAIKECSAPATSTHIHLPRAEAKEGETAPRNRGFAFVEFVVSQDVAVAVKAMNAMKVCGRVVAVDASVSKDAFESLVAGDGEAETGADAVADDEEMPDAADEEQEAEGDDDDAVEGDEGDEMDEDGEEAGQDEAAGADEDDDDDEADAHDDDDAVEEDVEVDYTEPAAAPAPAPRVNTDVDAGVEPGSTLFVRNLPYDATEDRLYQCMKAYGPVKYARLVMDRATQMPKGTAFVQFYTREGADRALAASGSTEAGVATPEPVSHLMSLDPRERARTAAAAAVAAAIRDGGVKMDGRVLFLMRAVSKTTASTLTTDRSSTASKKYDKRHTYLSYEGNVRGDGDLAAAMPKTDLDKRLAAQREKKTKLASPMFFVSPVRLSVRNLAKHVTDAQLRTLARDAAKAGMAAGLVAHDEGDPTLRIAAGTRPRVMVAKARVMREDASTARVRMEDDGVTPRSRGFGFVQFTEHVHALACLRELNNNPAYTNLAAGGGRALATGAVVAERPRLIVEFTLENVKEVRKQERKTEYRKVLNEAGVKPTAASAATIEVTAAAGGPAKREGGGKGATRKGERPNAGKQNEGAAAAQRKEGARRGSMGRDAVEDKRPVKRVHFASSHGSAAASGGMDAEIAAALHDDDGLGVGERKGASRRSKSRATEAAEEAQHARLVGEYSRKLFGGDAAAMTAWM